MAERASKDVRRFRGIVETYDRAIERKWRAQADRIIKRYADQRSESESTRARYNILWSNVETLKPFLYSQTPKPSAERRYKDPDPIARLACEVLERALTYTLQETHFGSALRNARDDYLLTGRGTAWVRYVPHYKPVQVEDIDDSSADEIADPATAGEVQAQPDEVVEFEEVVADYVNWRDFGHTVARVWEEVDAVWRLVRMSRTALVKRFGAEIGSKVPLDCSAKPEHANGLQSETDEDRALVYELWCKSERKVYWFTKAYPEMLDERDDPLGLDEFFPCPRPIFATLTTDSLIPIPDYVEYQDQAGEIDNLTARIDGLTKAIKAAGVYNADVPALQELLQDGHDNTLIPVTNWAALSEKGGLTGSVELLPMKDVASALIELYNAREKTKADLYEITGMSDIIRGNTAPDETATAQKIKTNFATKRLAERQGEVARFASNLVAIMGNVIARTFSPDTLVLMTGIKLLTVAEKQAFTPPPQPMPGAIPSQPQQPPEPPRGMTPDELQAAMTLPTWDDVFKLLHDNPERRFRISVQTDSLVSPDDAADKQDTVEFFQAVGGFLQQAVQAAEQQPEMAPLLGKMLLFGVRRFRIARELESDFEEAVDKLDQAAKQPKPTPPDPAMIKVNGELQLQQQRQKFEQAQATQKAAQDAQQAQHDQMMAKDAQLHQHRMDIVGAHQAQQEGASGAQSDMLKAHIDAALAQQAEQFKADTAVLVAHIQNLGKIEVARITADAAADAQAEQHEEGTGA